MKNPMPLCSGRFGAADLCLGLLFCMTSFGSPGPVHLLKRLNGTCEIANGKSHCKIFFFGSYKFTTSMRLNAKVTASPAQNLGSVHMLLGPLVSNCIKQNWWQMVDSNSLTLLWSINHSGQMEFHQPRFLWNSRGCPETSGMFFFSGNRSCDVAISFDQNHQPDPDTCWKRAVAAAHCSGSPGSCLSGCHRFAWFQRFWSIKIFVAQQKKHPKSFAESWLCYFCRPLLTKKYRKIMSKFISPTFY